MLALLGSSAAAKARPGRIRNVRTYITNGQMPAV
jgi:hypothetical protein